MTAFTNNFGESENVIRAFFDTMPQLGWLARKDGFVDLYNERFFEYTGYNLNELVGRGWDKIVDPELLPDVAARWNHSVATLEHFEMKIPLRRYDGTFRWFLTRATPVFDDKGECVRWVGINTDIQDEIDQAQLHANQQLQMVVQERSRKLAHVEALAESVIESIADAIVLADSTGRLTYLNQAARDMLGNDPAPSCLKDAANNKRNYDHTGETLLSEEELPLSKAMKGQHVNDSEMMLRAGTGQRRIVSVSARPIIDKSDEFRGAVAVVRDITARKNAEIALKQARDQALEASKLKSQFLANMSHEIRTPMNGILAFSELLYEESEGDARELAERVFTSAQYLMRLLNDLLDLSKAEAGKIVVTEEVVQLKNLVTEVCSMFYGTAAKKKLDLFHQISDSVPACVYCDPGLVRQILQNLIQNAIKFTDSGFVQVNVDVESRCDESVRIRFSVKDSGVGISAEDQQKLFQVFVQVDGSTTRRHQGTGLGLALSKRLVEAMNGEIAVESKKDEGSVFSFTLPFKAYSLK
jgi:PAS domain S-box-containing protein